MRPPTVPMQAAVRFVYASQTSEKWRERHEWAIDLPNRGQSIHAFHLIVGLPTPRVIAAWARTATIYCGTRGNTATVPVTGDDEVPACLVVEYPAFFITFQDRV